MFCACGGAEAIGSGCGYRTSDARAVPLVGRVRETLTVSESDYIAAVICCPFSTASAKVTETATSFGLLSYYCAKGYIRVGMRTIHRLCSHRYCLAPSDAQDGAAPIKPVEFA